MIAFRIWRTYSQSAKYVSTGASGGRRTMRNVMLTVIESGVIYSVSLLILLGVFVSKNEANVPMSDSVCPSFLNRIRTFTYAQLNFSPCRWFKLL